MGRPSLTLPEHRRPAWAKNSMTYRANITHPRPRQKEPRRDHGPDNFSYNAAHLRDLAIPPALTEALPKELAKAATDWTYAAAALHTSLDRIQKLDENPVQRTEPLAASFSSSSTWSGLGSNDTDAETDAITSATTTSPSDLGINAAVAKYNNFPVVNPYTKLPTSMLGMESPPFTPVDSKGPGTPTHAATAAAATSTNAMLPTDLSRLNAQLYPLMAHRASLTPSCAEDMVCADKTWERFVKSYNAEIYDLKHHCMTRFVGCTRHIDKLLLEVEIKGDASAEHLGSALHQFGTWWSDANDKVSHLRAKARSLNTKSLN